MVVAAVAQVAAVLVEVLAVAVPVVVVLEVVFRFQRCCMIFRKFVSIICSKKETSHLLASATCW